MNPLEEIATLKYFNEEYCRFREIMGSRKYAREAKITAFGALFTLSVNLPAEDQPKIEVTWIALCHEFTRRLELEAMLDNSIATDV